MKFVITRTSSRDNEKPCEGAILEKYIRVDQRGVDDPAKIPAYQGKVDWWYSEGSNHRVENGNITRDLKESYGWVIEINLLEDLVRLGEKLGEPLIIGNGGTRCKNSVSEIEIYDSYRE